ncbi:C-type lectin domain family 4 member G-like isoform X3 [Canis lupus baileyi]|uniref:C-type lectin domain family 4 member G isoform X2 n=1 Tax=Canis lupus familiaris TaxID=9615 RepID=UPI0003ADCE75|nr:C-type lectin domain family 4 member G isoform X2 [Canis lupus familiaris]XP_038282505.1 C-type lectin domain family 4 member G isoform X2 [Canis lupus familiaris]XP_038421232.1 C-type lectin domain family 4 member G isoform X2 [Canis lupus familiaris]|eukprot:XP_005632813.1 C-type lectin domain family 4 member G isoform X2 [Canis lupus familiaris]
MDEARHSPNPSEITALRAELPPQQGNTGQWGQTSQDKTWKYLCFFVSLILLLTVIILSVILSEVTQGLGDAGHDRDFIRSEVFRQMKAVLAGNESSCEPCPLDWKFFQGSCYFFSLDNLTWTQANDSCVQKQAHLVIINSRTEQDFLTSTGQVTSWIGLFKEGQKGNHRWMDGSTPTYINWDSKELPDNVTAPACMMMYNYGHWRDFSCESGQFAFICERRQNC